MSNESLSKHTVLPTLTGSKNWNNGIQGQPLSISFSFISFLPFYYFSNDIVNGTEVVNVEVFKFFRDAVDSQNPANFSELTPNQKAAAYLAMHAWSSVANITFDNAGDNNLYAVITLSNATFTKLDVMLGRWDMKTH